MTLPSRRKTAGQYRAEKAAAAGALLLRRGASPKHPAPAPNHQARPCWLFERADPALFDEGQPDHFIGPRAVGVGSPASGSSVYARLTAHVASLG